MNTIHQTTELLQSELGVALGTTLARLVVAAILGGIIGLERQLRHKPAGLRTNLFICFGSAMFTVLSDQLAGSWGAITRGLRPRSSRGSASSARARSCIRGDR